MNKKGETFGCLLGMSSAVFFAVGLFICLLSRFYCSELDFSEEQRSACQIKANFILLFGLAFTIGSFVAMLFSGKILGFFEKSSQKIK